jgi:DNA-binding NarL/FixJ family response regulator
MWAAIAYRTVWRRRILRVVQVLLVDDSAIVRLRVAELLESVEHVTIAGQARGVTQAIAAMRDLRPDLVILDIQLPDGDGVAVLQAAKQLDPAPVVIMLTNHDDDFHRQRCRAGGADFFLDKSKQFAEIPEILRGLMRQGVTPRG